MYEIELPREYAAIYLAWEVGERLAADFLSNFPDGIIRIPCGVFRDNPVRNRTEAERYLQRVRLAIAYEEGRRGKELSSPVIRLEKRIKSQSG